MKRLKEILTKKIVLAAVLVVFLIIVILAVGAIVPRMTLKDGVENYGSGERFFSEHALKQAEGKIGKWEKLWITGIQIKRARKTVDDNRVVCLDYPFVVRGKFKADVEVYTLFGFSYAKVRVTCWETSIKRWFSKNN